jgi:hypothetical protein
MDTRAEARRREHGVPQNSQWAIADAAAREAGWVRPTGWPPGATGKLLANKGHNLG